MKCSLCRKQLLQQDIFSRRLLSDLVGRTKNTAALDKKKKKKKKMFSELTKFGQQFTFKRH